MRDRSTWYRDIAKDLTGQWSREGGQTRIGARISLLCRVELGLRLLQHLDPAAPPEGVWPLISGYPFARAAGLVRGEREERMLTAARHLLWTLRRRSAWQQALERYRDIPEHLRGYRLPGDGGPARWVGATTAGRARLETYDAALGTLPPFARRELPLAPPGESRFLQRRRWTSVHLPEELAFAPAPGHDLTAPHSADPGRLNVPLAELAETAEWLEKAEAAADPVGAHGDWVRRLTNLHVDWRTANGRGFTETNTLRLDGLLHMVGMVGAGKTTLMVLLAAWAARRGLRTTLVVGDVAEQLRLTELLRGAFITFHPDQPPVAAPIIGGSMRERHVQRLHRRRAARGGHSLLTHDDPAFDHLSTVCVVDALRGVDPAEPLRHADAPCTGLFPVEAPAAADSEAPPAPYRSAAPESAEEGAAFLAGSRDDPSGAAHGCPLWSACPRHRAARELVDALVWIATPASLVHTAVPGHLNAERLRYLELAAIRSDIVVVDEADRVQMQLDGIFAPSATLVAPGPESWLDRLRTHNIGELARQGRLPLSEQEVQRWSASLDVVGAATNRLYGMLIADPKLREWADIDYFSAWTLQEKLLNEWFPRRRRAADGDGLPRESDVYDDGSGPDGTAPADGDEEPPEIPEDAPWAEDRARVTAALDAFRDDPLGGRGPHSPLTDKLTALAQDLLHTLNETESLQRVGAFLTDLLAGSPAARGELPAARPQPGSAPDPADTPGTPAWHVRTARRLAFTLRLAALHHRLERITFLWPQVEAALRLDSTDNELSRRPPLDYAPVVPEAPMGNILGFQYLPDEADRQRDPEGRCTGTLRFFRCAGIGRELLLGLPELGADPAHGRHGTRVLLMSGTSWAGKSTRAHVLAPVDAVLRPNATSLEAVAATEFTTRYVYESGVPLKLSGQDPRVRPMALRTMVGSLARGSGGVPSPLEEELQRVKDVNRRRALLLVGSYKEADCAAARLEEFERWRGRVRVLVPDDAVSGAENVPVGSADPRAVPLRRGDLAAFAEDPDAELLVAPLLAIERGHNVLNAAHKAAFGTVLFLARPHPRPDDLSLAVFAVNDWATRFVRDMPDRDDATFTGLVAEAGGLDAAGRAFRAVARGEWRRLLSRRYIYSRLSDGDRTAFVWDQLVTVWQVIGRLVRGGVPARVVFVDAAFAPRHAAALAPGADPATAARARAKGPEDGLLAGMREVLAPYFADPPQPPPGADPADPALVHMLYRPLYLALRGMGDAADRPTGGGAPAS
ncbi:hypothetical protein ACFPZ0_00675 [Streptomonospora nanhaiensis]|uniref:pPIWI_RE_Z domain-containing protein n=1 Tax=Streptomonospora nanhaiensis TaxID=1323731 RepID=UPI001C994342|nr:hypothetical protein [Streptomonospora nanhaiensis]MBX9386927.1 hypothetical protein [Streptomonospora nanhaiensis]